MLAPAGAAAFLANLDDVPAFDLVDLEGASPVAKANSESKRSAGHDGSSRESLTALPESAANPIPLEKSVRREATPPEA